MSKQADGSRLSYESSGSRQVRATALGRGTQGVPDVRRSVEAQFHVAFPHRVWVAGQVALPLGDDEGTLRFSLAAATTAEPFVLPCAVPAEQLPAVRDLLGRAHDAAVEDVVREGRLARVGGLLRFDAERGGVVLLVSELDPTPTAVELAEARAAVLERVRELGLAEQQRTRTCVSAPAAVAVVGGQGDAAPEAVQAALAASGYGVRARVLAVPVTGPDAGRQVAEAVRTAAAASDLVLLVRDEGRPLGLASYDALEVAQAVADAPVPVLTGLGGAGTVTAADEVAFASVPTALDAAHWVVARLERAEHRLDELTAEVAGEVEAAAQRCRSALEQVRADVETAGGQAVGRAEQARRRVRLQLRIACAVVAVLAVVAAVVLGVPLLALLVLLPLVVLGGVELWWSRARTRGDRHMGTRDDDFEQIVGRLSAVRDELRSSTSPERVAALRETAGALVARGRELLGKHLPAAAHAAQEPAAPPAEPVQDTAGPTSTDAAEGTAGPAPGEDPAPTVVAPVARPLPPDETVALVEGGASGGWEPQADRPSDDGWVHPDPPGDGPAPGGSTRIRSSS